MPLGDRASTLFFCYLYKIHHLSTVVSSNQFQRAHTFLCVTHPARRLVYLFFVFSPGAATQLEGKSRRRTLLFSYTEKKNLTAGNIRGRSIYKTLGAKKKPDTLPHHVRLDLIDGLEFKNSPWHRTSKYCCTAGIYDAAAALL